MPRRIFDLLFPYTKDAISHPHESNSTGALINPPCSGLIVEEGSGSMTLMI